MSNTKNTPDPETDDALTFSVWRETKVLPRRRLAAFRCEVDALAFAEHRARIEGENEADIDTTVWVPSRDGSETLYQTFPANALNVHDEMLAALRKAVVLLAAACVHAPDELDPYETYEAVSAAIAKTTSTTS